MAMPAIQALPLFSAPPRRVGYSAMATRKYGADLVKALVPRYFATQNELHSATGIAYSSVNDWANGKSAPRFEQLDKIAQAIEAKTGEKIDPLELLLGPAGKGGAPRVREQPWWLEVLAKAMEMYPRTPKFAFEHIGALMGENLPPPDPVLIGTMASAWYQAADDTERSDALIAKAEREMAEEDAAHASPPVPISRKRGT